MDERKNIGQKGEKLAEKYLRKKAKMKLLERNLRFKQGEIDLLMRDGDELVIVEVRTVSNRESLDRFDRVPPSKQKQLIRLGNVLLNRLPEPLPTLRYDICLVVMEPEPVVTHMIDAFRPR